LLALVDDGLLQTDLSPPLIGPAPAHHLRDRLVALHRDADARLIEDAQVAFEAGDIARAHQVNERLAPLVAVFYAPPFVDMHNRMKEALALLGRIPAAHVRPPLTPISDDERQRIRLALRAARLL